MGLAGGQVDRLALIVLGLSALCGLIVAFRSSSKLALICWLMTIGFVPVWLGVPFIFIWVPATVMGILLLITTLRWSRYRLGPADALVAGLALVCLAPMVAGGAWSTTSVYVVLAQWMLAFAIGRTIPGGPRPLVWVYSVVAVVMGCVALVALVEFALGWNPFVSLAVPGRDYELWSVLQERGGILRAEGAFGHSIALGCSLALAIPLTLGCSLTARVRAGITIMLLLGSVVTFSRVGILAAFLGVLLSIIGMSRESISRRARAAALVVTTLVSLAVVPLASSVFSAAGEEAARSAAYRAELLGLLPTLSVFGYSSAAYRNTAGELEFLGFKSIDSALILLGLTYGWIALVLAALLLVMAVVPVLRRRATPPLVALVAQIPALATVALITQYSMFLWFVAGLAAASVVRPSRATAGGSETGRPSQDVSASSVADAGPQEQQVAFP